MKRLSILILLWSLSLAGGVSAQDNSSTVRQLTPGKTIDREISGGQTQSFVVTLPQDGFLRAVVNSHNIDVVATLYGPDGQKVLTVNLLKYPGPEPVSFEAQKAGEYRLDILADAAGVLHGQYGIVSDVKPHPNETDRQRLTAERLLINANELEREGSKESLQKSIDSRGDALVFWHKFDDKYWQAYSLHCNGRGYAALKKYQEALALYSEALSIRKVIGDRFGEASTINNFGIVYERLGQNEEALDYYGQAFAIYRAVGERIGMARALNNLGSVYYTLGDSRKALESYSQVLPIKRELGDKSGEADTLVAIGVVYSGLGEKQKVLEFLNQALPILRELGDKSSQAAIFGTFGNIYSSLGEKQKALESYNEALLLERAVGDRDGEANNLIGLGIVYSDLGDNQKALEFYNQALPLKKEGGDKRGEAMTLNNMGTSYKALGDTQKALEFYNQALPLRQEIGDKSGEADTLYNLGVVYTHLGDSLKALEFYNQALPLKRAVSDKSAEANILSGLGMVYSNLGEHQKALGFYTQALTLRRVAGDKLGEAATLGHLGAKHQTLGENQKALGFYNQALTLRRALGDKSGEAELLNNLGTLYSDLGENQKALDYYNQALSLRLALGDKRAEAASLNNLGTIYDILNENQKALEFYNQALPLRRSVGDKSGEARTLNNIGVLYQKMGENQKALELSIQALPISQAVGDKTIEADTLINIGVDYEALGEHQKALDFISRALPLKRAVGDKNGEALVLGNLMKLMNGLGRPALAIFYGKQAINTYQHLRGNIQGLEKETQRSFLNTIGDVYKYLAGILVAENRLDEATQVINLLRDQEFFDFDRDVTRLPGQTVLTAHESENVTVLQVALERVITAGQSLETLKGSLANRPRTQSESTELSRLEAEFEKATAGFSGMIKTIEVDFGKPAAAIDRVGIVPDTRDMQTALRELKTSTKQEAATLYTLVSDDKFYVILIEADGEIRRFESLIKAADLNKKILQFYALLQTPAYDPRPLGKELYDIIFKPVEAELKKTGVQTLMWQLDGNLRYLPMAALFDGDKYLVERFQNVVFTRADKERMTRAVTQNWTGKGFGSSKAYTVDLLGDGAKVNFDALPGVTAELTSIFGTPRSNGIMKGNVYTDAEFTRNAFYEAMKQHHPLVHISSHFAFRPGDDSRSFLLLGDGTALTLNELKKQTRLFDGVELLTLSACKTALQKANADGREIDGFAELTQRLGAGAVIATLWSVSDNSTPYLMSDFYRVRQHQNGTTKAAAMRQAQLALLNGKARVKPLSNQSPATKGGSDVTLQVVLVPASGQRDQGSRRDTDSFVYVNEKDAPPYRRDASKPYAHPYYWAPFVVFGNWR